MTTTYAPELTSSKSNQWPPSLKPLIPKQPDQSRRPPTTTASLPEEPNLLPIVKPLHWILSLSSRARGDRATSEYAAASRRESLGVIGVVTARRRRLGEGKEGKLIWVCQKAAPKIETKREVPWIAYKELRAIFTTSRRSRSLSRMKGEILLQMIFTKTCLWKSSNLSKEVSNSCLKMSR